MSQPTDLVLFHGKCNDGLFSAYAHWLKKRPTTNVIYQEVYYQDYSEHRVDEVLGKLFGKIEDLDNLTVYIFDFSFEPEVIEVMATLVKRVIMLDHHLTAYKKYLDYYHLPYSDQCEFQVAENVTVEFDMKHSGAMLAYNHFFPTTFDYSIPEWFKYVEDRDLWKFNYDETKSFHQGVKNVVSGKRPTSPEFFSQLHSELVNGNVKQVIKTGERLLVATDERIRKNIHTGYIVRRILGSDVALINAESDVASDLASVLISVTGINIAIVYHMRPITSCIGDLQVIMSIRSAKGIDCSFIAKEFGGGGHSEACGCSVSLEKFNSLIE